MSTVLPALAIAGVGFLFYKLVMWWTNAPSLIAVIASIIVIVITYLIYGKTRLTKKDGK
jgi:L-lactate permease